MRKPSVGIFADTPVGPVGSLIRMKLMLCYAEGVDAVFFFADDVDYEKHIVNAYAWSDKGLIREVVELPFWVECGPRTDKNYRYFSEHCRIIDDYTLSKKAVNDALLNSKFAENVIPTFYTAKPERILGYLAYWDEIIVKPLAGARGEGIVCIKISENKNYRFTYTSGEIKELSFQAAVELIEGLYYQKTVIVQPRLHFTNKDGKTMDFRLNVTKGEGGKWTKVFIIPRTGRDNIVSNFSCGGYASLLEPTLKIDFGENAGKVLDMLNDIGDNLPPFIEEASHCHMLSLGIDVGIDFHTLRPYIIEVNYVPKLTFPDKAKYMYIQVAYLKHLHNQIARD